MSMRFFAAIFKQTTRNLLQTGWVQLMTLLAVGLSVLMFAFFALVYANVLKAGQRLDGDIRLIVYFQEEISPKLLSEMERKIKEFHEVERVVAVDRQQAFERLAERLGDDKDVLEDLGPGFLPPSLEVYPKATLESLPRLKALADYLQTLPGVQKIQYGHHWLERFSYFTQLLRLITIMSGVLLVLTTTFMVSYTIRLAVFTRHQELEVLRLLGASSAYLRVPLLLEGLIQGIVGASGGLTALYFLFTWITKRFSGPGILSFFQFTFFPLPVLFGILLASVLLCAGGSLLSIRKFLRI